jgi:hypothetical protein
MPRQITSRAALSDLIEHYLDARGRRHEYVSLKSAQKALAQIVPSEAKPDRKLDNLIATRAVARGLCVDFDRADEDGSLA